MRVEVRVSSPEPAVGESIAPGTRQARLWPQGNRFGEDAWFMYIPEGAGWCQAGSACSFALAKPFAGHGELASCVPLPALLPVPCAREARVKDRASAGPAWPAPQASLTRVTARR